MENIQCTSAPTTCLVCPPGKLQEKKQPPTQITFFTPISNFSLDFNRAALCDSNIFHASGFNSPIYIRFNFLFVLSPTRLLIFHQHFSFTPSLHYFSLSLSLRSQYPIRFVLSILSHSIYEFSVCNSFNIEEQKIHLASFLLLLWMLTDTMNALLTIYCRFYLF